MHRLRSALTRFVGETDGQSLVEYGLLAALIAIVVAASVTDVGNQIRTLFWDRIPNAL